MKGLTDVNNKQIRKNAWALYKANFQKLLPAMVLLQLLTFLPGIVIGRAAPGGLVELLATQLSTMLFAPITLCGVAAFSLDILHGGAPKTHLMFAHVKDFRRTLKIWLAALAYYGPVLALNATTLVLLNVASVPSEKDVAEIGTLLLLLALILVLTVFGIWLSLRFTLFSYAVVKNPEAGAGEWLKTSWRAMKGNCGRQIRMVISIFWPGVVVGLIISLVAGRSGAGSAINLPTLSIMIFQCFYMGYPLLALAGFADSLLVKDQNM